MIQIPYVSVLNSGDRMKKIGALLGTLLLVMSSCITTVHAAVENPFAITGTNIEKGQKEFDFAIRLNRELVLSAFELSVEYDGSVLDVADEPGSGYAYTDGFKAYYGGGLLVCNDKADTEVVFAGAGTGLGSYAGEVATIHFKTLKEDAFATTVKLKIKTVGSESGTETIKLDLSNPITSYSVVLKEYNGLLGDVNFDNRIGLEDAQLALKAALKITVFDVARTIAGDVDFDGKITLSDAQIILKKALKIIP